MRGNSTKLHNQNTELQPLITELERQLAEKEEKLQGALTKVAEGAAQKNIDQQEIHKLESQVTELQGDLESECSQK